MVNKINFVDDRGIYHNSWGKTYIDTVESLNVLLKVDTPERVGFDLVQRAYSEVASEEYENTYKEMYGVRRSKGHTCIQRLIGKRTCDGSNCRPPGSDHAKLWIRDGKPFSFTFEPYHLRKNVLKELIIFCEDHGLDFEISNSSMHFPAGTTFVDIRVSKKN